MLILRPYQPKVLLPVPVSSWRSPSQAEWKDQFGNPGVRTRFRVDGLLDDGHRLWREWFEDRDEFDDFLWRLPFVPGLRYDFATVTNLTTTGSLLTYTSPIDWNDANNTIECVGGGAGGARSSSTINVTGSGGGAYSAIANLTFATPGTTTASYRVGDGGAARSGSGGDGNAGTDTWFNGANLGASSCGAKAGVGGTTSGVGAINGGAGGASGSGVGTTKYSGGRGGNITVNGNSATGGGSAAADNGNGNNGGDTGSTNTETSGGSEPSGLGGAGGAGKYTGVGNAGSGSTYGGGGGGSTSLGSSGAGAQGIIRVTYTPASTGAFFQFF